MKRMLMLPIIFGSVLAFATAYAAPQAAADDNPSAPMADDLNSALTSQNPDLAQSQDQDNLQAMNDQDLNTNDINDGIGDDQDNVDVN